jgi:hypothetical protein
VKIWPVTVYNSATREGGLLALCTSQEAVVAYMARRWPSAELSITPEYVTARYATDPWEVMSASPREVLDEHAEVTPDTSSEETHRTILAYREEE